MFRKSYRPKMERLEQRQLLSASSWFEDSGQSVGTNTDGAEFGDLDGDGDLDLLVGCRNWPGGPTCSETQVWLNDGSGRFSRGWSTPEVNVGRIALGDLDGDGDLDAYFAKGSPSAPGNPNYGEREQYGHVWLNDGQGNFEDTGQQLDEGAFGVTLVDIDGDLDLDAVTANPVDASKILLNDGAGTFTDSGQRLLPLYWAFDVAVGDVDSDGDLDLYFARAVDSPTDRLYLNDGQGNFTDSGQGLDSNWTLGVRLADLDDDGDMDAFLVNGNEVSSVNQPNRVYLNDGSGMFTDSGQSLGNSISYSVELADLDGDGDLDAFVSNGVRQRGRNFEQPNEIWLNDGAGVFTLAQQLGNAASLRVSLGDVDNDGDLDAFIGNIGQDNQIWINTQAIPLQGSIQAVETNTVQESTLFVDASGSGNASAIGRFTVAYQFEVNLSNFAGIGTARFFAANGDSVFTEITGQGTVPDPFSSIVETHTITGGTGRFDGAAGSFLLERVINTETGVTSGSFDGIIEINTQPLRGTVEAVETLDVQPPTLFVDASGSGNSTHLGNFTVNYNVEVDTSTFAGTGTTHFIAANGDSLFTEIIGQGTVPDPISSIVETHTITGGTGRFAGATGGFILERVINTETGITSGAFDGNILIPVTGDSNRDGRFDSADLVLVLQAGGYEDGILGNSTFEEGDWNGDGEFDALDIVFALQQGNYMKQLS